jgi:hypothetical protein
VGADLVLYLDLNIMEKSLQVRAGLAAVAHHHHHRYHHVAHLSGSINSWGFIRILGVTFRVSHAAASVGWCAVATREHVEWWLWCVIADLDLNFLENMRQVRAGLAAAYRC